MKKYSYLIRRFVKRHLPYRWQRFIQFIIRKKRVLITKPNVYFKFIPEKAAKSNFRTPTTKRNLLDELGAKYRPTKREHNYLVHYWMHFQDIRFDVKNVLEIGIQTDRSMCMWEEFFPNAMIYGIDIDAQCKQYEGGRRKIFIGDQSDISLYKNIIHDVGNNFDIIIDDGSHRVDHQLKTFSLYFPSLSDHGIYVIEDTGGCVGDPELITVNAMKSLIDSIMYWPKGFDPKLWPHLVEFPNDAKWIDKNIVGIAFYRWIVFIMRGNNPKDNPFLTFPDTKNIIRR
jgi:hypothetical protein